MEMKGLEEKPRSCLPQLSPSCRPSLPELCRIEVSPVQPALNSLGVQSGTLFTVLNSSKTSCPPNAKREHIKVFFLGIDINNSQTLSTYCVLATLQEFSFILQNLLRVYVMVNVESQFDKI